MTDQPQKFLGKKEVKRDHRNLMAARYMASTFPEAYDWQKGRTPVPARTYGNTSYGDCTLASQANCLVRFERLEARRTILLPDQLVIGNYLNMTGGVDEGWYELDALKRWRSTGFTPREGRTYTVDAFAEINPRNISEIKAALWQFKVVKVCFALPWAWSSIEPKGYGPEGSDGLWDVGVGPDYELNSWGGHSMMADAYDGEGLWVQHTWYSGPTPARQKVTWAAVQKYCDEAYSVVDSFNSWRARRAVKFNVEKLAADVAEVTAS